ncbi:Phospho-N-acetylmuramoyl-pentapeptide-transferase [Candidatus Syntrophocurvum alkaliphilum]|uniref:Phospho-N-acetylmuramoyl-pentapeptide-transferase n=1 Tax=Candidatus Syntrophocurvum alkaliphilum TaxID=2293317 RepID=A0A6I6D803_9FIRM|nr:phospho-N-acetylmuramoyl-pentapeptide-transferase [Candidatus Syntrophocurvum alkaliphilum]QGT99133.1 Phospho-N-acetylmuramoyl-pentapeptide-transferase [Candidatus Syntrophocurvum alkaliphilum]
MEVYILNSLLAASIALIISIILGPIMIPFLTRLKVGQNIREEGPESHFEKAGTPTMGGIIILSSVMVASFVVAPTNIQVLLALFIMLAFGAIGFWDDYIKVVLKRSLGLRAREKLILQLLIGLLFAIILIFYIDRGTDIIVPFTGYNIELGYLYIPFVILVLLGTSNAVNLTDGLDGLAAGTTVFVSIAFALVCIMTSNFELLIFAGALFGGCLGFLVYNKHPAKVFMGDTGSMALGGAIAAIAAMTKAELFLVIIGGIYVIEALSVIIQVGFYQLTGKRVFLMSPIHHHFELKGWHEKKVVIVFWIISFVFAAIGILGFRNIG